MTRRDLTAPCGPTASAADRSYSGCFSPGVAGTRWFGTPDSGQMQDLYAGDLGSLPEVRAASMAGATGAAHEYRV